MIDEEPTIAEPTRPLGPGHRAALITAVITGVFGSLQSMQGADADRTAKRFERSRDQLAETYDTLAANQNIISEALTKLSRRNNALKKRVLELERAVKRLEIGVDDDAPIILFESTRKPIRISPLPTITHPPEGDE